MADYSNIQRIIIKKPVTNEDLFRGLLLLQDVKNDIAILKENDKKGWITPIAFKHISDTIDSKFEKIAQTLGFASADDLKYYQEHFKL